MSAVPQVSGRPAAPSAASHHKNGAFVSLLVGVFVLALPGQMALAQEATVTPVGKRTRPIRGGLEFGGYGAITGPIDRGYAMAAVLEPGGRFKRLGLAVRAVVDTSFDGGAILAGLTFEPAASRPRLALSLHGEAGFTVGNLGTARQPVVGGGLTTYLWPITKARPVGLAFDSTGLFYYDGVDSRLALGASLRLIFRN